MPSLSFNAEPFRSWLQLESEEFDAFFSSPLQRAAVTGEIIWGGRQGAVQARSRLESACLLRQAVNVVIWQCVPAIV